jgi:hypothetical protein
LKKAVTIEQGQQQVDALNARNLDRFPQFRQILLAARFHTTVVPLRDDLVRDVKPTLYLLWGGALFVLLIGSVNVANPCSCARPRVSASSSRAWHSAPAAGRSRNSSSSKISS